MLGGGLGVEARTSGMGLLRRLAYRKGAGKNGKGKGKSHKGGEKGKNKKRRGNSAGSPAGGCAAQTPDGTKVCYKFNNIGGCTQQNCAFAHVCGRCFAAGVPMHRCKRCGTAPQ